MKQLLCLSVTLLALSPHSVFADEQQEFQLQSKAVIKEFATTLKGALVGAMKSGGPTEAIQVCNQVAPMIAATLSEKYGLEIARTSLKVRNPDNKANCWEQKVLKQFEDRKQAGEEITTLIVSEKVASGDSQELRIMKAIPTGKVCLSCHGSNIAEPVQASLSELYPGDQATGYQLGDIRGAFTIRKTIEQ
ncbi:MAG: hypothetical protein COA83_04655 [Methylophaga sp.]|nr:MAG: hypothetical protein COA83_04655 [Methylophaga sp.]